MILRKTIPMLHIVAILAFLLGSMARLVAQPDPDLSGIGADQSLFNNASFSGSSGITYYVKTDGSDSNNGLSLANAFKTIQKAIDVGKDEYNANNKNVKIKISPGTYREAFLLAYLSGRSNVVVLERNGSGTVTVTGASSFNSGWTSEGNNVYSHSWNSNWGFGDSPWSSQDAVLNTSVLARREGVFSGGAMLEQRLNISYSNLNNKQFLVDETANRLYIKDTSLSFSGSAGNLTASKNIEVMNRLNPDGDHGSKIKNVDNVKVQDINFIRYPTLWLSGGFGAAQITNLWINRCTFEQNAASGLRILNCDKITVKDSVCKSNGSLGFAGTGTDKMRVVDSEFKWNNKRGAWMGYGRWYIAGAKIGQCDKVLIDRCDFLSNDCHGLWFDVGCTNQRIRDCIMTNNELAGEDSNALFYEISSGPVRIEGCMMSGSVHGAYISNSWNTYLLNNDIFGNTDAQVALRNDPGRAAPSPGPYCKNFWMRLNRVSTTSGAKLVKGLANNSQYQNCLNDATINDNTYEANTSNVFQKVIGTNVNFNNWKNSSSPVRDTNSTFN